MARFLPALLIRVADQAVDRVLRNAQERISELQGVAIVKGRAIKGVQLPDATDVPVAHGMDRAVSVVVSPPRGGPSSTGRIVDRTTDAAADGSKYIVLRATGWGATVTVDLWVY